MRVVVGLAARHASAWAACALLLTGCAQDAIPVTASGDANADATLPGPPPDLLPAADLFEPRNECGSHEATCGWAIVGPPLPLQSDPMPDPRQLDFGLKRDANGYLVQIAGNRRPSNALWIPNRGDVLTGGTVSKYGTRQVREVARYRSVTCGSLKTGNTNACDGEHGCCSRDDWNRYQARKAKMPEPGHQQIELGANLPSRTAMDANGDLFVANQAFGRQSSVTRIADDIANCVDRNKNGRIDTSSDTDGDGTIQIDCNGNGIPDSIADVLGKPCGNGLRQEYYDLDDECVLWTTNTFPNNSTGRGLAAVPRQDGSNDVWASGGNVSIVMKIDGVTGLGAADPALPRSCTSVANLLADASGILWAADYGAAKLCWLDTAHPNQSGTVRDPQWGPAKGYGLTIDRDQNVWLGSDVARYTPDRTSGTARLGSGSWTKFGAILGNGIVADARNDKSYFLYSCDGQGVIQIPAWVFPPTKMDQVVNNPGWLRIKMPCYGVAVDTDQNVWGINDSFVTRAKVDKAGGITQPVVNGPPVGKNKCPLGDSCLSNAAEVYSDFTGFNAVRPSGGSAARYRIFLENRSGCAGKGLSTHWFSLAWDADLPAGTTLGASYRTSEVPYEDPMWNGEWHVAGASPATVQLDGSYLEVEFTFDASVPGFGATLKSFRALSECR